MTQDRLENGSLTPIPIPGEQEMVEEVYPTEEQEQERPEPLKNDMSDLFDVPQEEDNDMYIDDLFEVDDEDVEMEDDLSDLTQVTEEDVMGTPPKPRPAPARYARTTRRYMPPTSLGGAG